MKTCRLASSIAEEVAPQVGFDPASILAIITALLPALQSLMAMCGGPAAATPQDYRDYITARYHGGGYAAGLLNPTIREILQASRGPGKKRMKRPDAETLATEALDQIRCAQDDVLLEAINVVHAG
jgi:hypothetical protein